MTTEGKTNGVPVCLAPLLKASPQQVWSLLDMIESSHNELDLVIRINLYMMGLQNHADVNARSPVRKMPNSEKIRLAMTQLMQGYVKLGVPAAAAIVDAAIKDFDRDKEWRVICTYLDSANTVFRTEAESWRFLIVSTQDAALYGLDKPFGKDVADKFRSARKDVVEATRCLALEQYGACVFHLMRAVERPLKATLLFLRSTQTGVTHKRMPNTWGAILAEINGHVYKNVSPNTRISPEESFGRQVCGYIESVREIRDSRTMHVDQALPDKETAVALYPRIKDMMVHMAQHIDEQGAFTP